MIEGESRLTMNNQTMMAWPEALGYARPNPAIQWAMDQGLIEHAPDDMGERNERPYPAQWAPNRGLPDTQGRRLPLIPEAGPASLLERFAGIPNGLVRPYWISVKRSWWRDLMTPNVSGKYKPVMTVIGDPRPQARRDSRRIPQRPALTAPTYRFKAEDEKEAMARAEARLRQRGILR